jgi:hypothetical protein
VNPPPILRELPPRQESTPEELEQDRANWRTIFGWEPWEHDLRNKVSLRGYLDHIKDLLGAGRPIAIMSRESGF